MRCIYNPPCYLNGGNKEEDMLDRMDETRRARAAEEELQYLRNRDAELIAMREHLAKQERHLDEARSKLKNEQLDRAKGFQTELDA